MSRKKKKAKKNSETLEAKSFRILKLVASATWQSATSRREEALEEYARYNDKAVELLSKLRDPESVFNMNITDESKSFLFREDVYDLRS